MIQLTSKYPIPSTHQQANNCKYPWRRMKVGDSFHVPLEGKDPFYLKGQLNTNGRAIARKIKAETGIDVKFVAGIRSNGVRVWRTE